MTEVFRVLEGRYVDSVLLMQISREIEKREGVIKAGAMVATPENLFFFKLAGFHPPDKVNSNSILLAIDAVDNGVAEDALKRMLTLINEGGNNSDKRYRISDIPSLISKNDFPIMFISTPGQYVKQVAIEALELGLNLHIFSSNVPLKEEVELKKIARSKNLLVMGPDCGTTIIDGHGIGFANKVRSGRDVCVIGSSGTGIQELTVQLDKIGLGVSFAIGTGSNDLKAEVGGITTEQAIKMLKGTCKTMAIICKTPDPELQEKIISQISDIPSAFISLGSSSEKKISGTLLTGVIDRAVSYLASMLGKSIVEGEILPKIPLVNKERKYLRGYFVGGSLCYQAQAILHGEGLDVYSNSPIDSKFLVSDNLEGRNICIDTGSEEYVAGKPHPMIDPIARNSQLVRDSARPDTRVLLFDVILGYGSAANPLDGLERLSKGAVMIASVCGTDEDSQGYSKIRDRLAGLGVTVFGSAADAAMF
ncbi:MAG: hypothetical protein QXW75_01410, partial [Thermoplasmatales archaeon]